MKNFSRNFLTALDYEVSKWVKKHLMASGCRGEPNLKRGCMRTRSGGEVIMRTLKKSHFTWFQVSNGYIIGKSWNARCATKCKVTIGKSAEYFGPLDGQIWMFYGSKGAQGCPNDKKATQSSVKPAHNRKNPSVVRWEASLPVWVQRRVFCL